MKKGEDPQLPSHDSFTSAASFERVSGGAQDCAVDVPVHRAKSSTRAICTSDGITTARLQP